MKPIVILGTGLAGYSLAREFRKLDKTTPLLLISADDGGSYSKPMLSNAFAQGKYAADLCSHSAAQMAAQLDATILPNSRVSQIDTAKKTLLSSSGAYAYHKLVLAVGAQAIRLPLAGNAAQRVLSVNNLADYAVLREQITASGARARIVILGAGLIGCEFADDLAGAGHAVTLVDPNPLPLAALAPPPVSQALQSALQQRGVQFRLGTSAASINAVTAAPGQLQVQLADGASLTADIVLSAVGLRPDLRLAQAAGLACGRGIQVDRHGQTSAADVYALGDCTEYTVGADGRQQTLPYVAPILSAARAIARSLGGEATAIALPPTAVIVKTPSCPLALLPPAPQLAGRWEHGQDGSARVSRFYDAANLLQGFALAPQEPRLRTALMAEIVAAAAA